MGRRLALVITPDREVTDTLTGLLADEDIAGHDVESYELSNQSSTELGRALVEFCSSLAFDDTP